MALKSRLECTWTHTEGLENKVLPITGFSISFSFSFGFSIGRSLAQVVTVTISSSKVSVAVSGETVSVTVMRLGISFSGSLGQGSDEMGEKVGSTDFGKASNSGVGIFVARGFSRSFPTATEASGSVTISTDWRPGVLAIVSWFGFSRPFTDTLWASVGIRSGRSRVCSDTGSIPIEIPGFGKCHWGKSCQLKHKKIWQLFSEFTSLSIIKNLFSSWLS